MRHDRQKRQLSSDLVMGTDDGFLLSIEVLLVERRMEGDSEWCSRWPIPLDIAGDCGGLEGIHAIEIRWESETHDTRSGTESPWLSHVSRRQ